MIMDTPTINQADSNAPQTIVERQKPPKRIKTGRMYLERAFPKAYIDNGLNGTKAYQSIKKTKNAKVATVSATRLLSKASVQKGIEALLPSEEETMKVFKEVYAAEREEILPYKDLHKFLVTDLQLRGKLKDNNSTNVQVNMVIDGNTTTHDKQL